MVGCTAKLAGSATGPPQDMNNQQTPILNKAINRMPESTKKERLFPLKPDL